MMYANIIAFFALCITQEIRCDDDVSVAKTEGTPQQLISTQNGTNHILWMKEESVYIMFSLRNHSLQKQSLSGIHYVAPWENTFYIIDVYF